jgi:succinoglycan biosynthesis transport protein ExoP
VTTLLVTAAAAAVAYVGRNSYRTTAQLLFSQTIGPELNALGLTPPAIAADRLAADNATFVGSRQVAAAAASALGDGTTVESMQQHIKTSGSTTSDVVDVVATADSPQRVAQLANAYAGAAIRLARQEQARRAGAIVTALTVQLQKLPPNSPAATGLRTRIAQVAALEAAGTGDPQLIQAGFVPSHASGKPLEIVLLGALFGVLLGVGLALLREQTDTRLRDAGAVSAAFDAPVLATVANNRALARHLPFPSLPSQVAAPFLMVQAHLRYGHSEPVRTLLVTSARAGQGKTTVAWNLANAAAASGLSTVLVDADLQRSSIASRYGLVPAPGLSEVLRGEVELAAAVQSVSTSGDAAQNGHPRALDVIVAGAPAVDASMLLQSERMTRVLSSLSQYRLVIVDALSFEQESGAISLLRLIDNVLVVAPLNSSRGIEAERLRGELEALDARVVGIVVMGGGRRGGGYISPVRPERVSAEVGSV